MLLLHPLPTCTDAGRDLCTFCPDLCTLRPDLCTLSLRCYPSINQRKYSTCTHGGGHWLQLALVAFFLQPLAQTVLVPVVVSPIATCTGVFFPPPTGAYTLLARATCTVWWWSVVVVVVCDVEVVVVAMGGWFNGTGWLGETTLASILYRPSN